MTHVIEPLFPTLVYGADCISNFEKIQSEIKENLNIDGGAQIVELEKGKWKGSGIAKGFIFTFKVTSEIELIEVSVAYITPPPVT